MNFWVRRLYLDVDVHKRRSRQHVRTSLSRVDASRKSARTAASPVTGSTNVHQEEAVYSRALLKVAGPTAEGQYRPGPTLSPGPGDRRGPDSGLVVLHLCTVPLFELSSEFLGGLGLTS